jgi:hypothetical protein
MLRRYKLVDDHLYQSVMSRERISDMALPVDANVHVPQGHCTYLDMLPDFAPMFLSFARPIIARQMMPFRHSRTRIPFQTCSDGEGISRTAKNHVWDTFRKTK